MQKLRILPPGFEHKVDFNLYNTKAVFPWACGQERVSDIQNESFYEAIQKALKKSFEEEKDFYLPPNFCNSFTVAQMDKIATLHPKVREDKYFIGSYFQKHFHEELSKENQEIWSNDEKRANLLILYKYASANKMPQSLQSSLLVEVLELGVKIGVYDEELFLKFAQNPMQKSGPAFNAKKKRESYGDSHWNRYIGAVQSAQSQIGNWDAAQTSLIDKYLEHFCHEKGSLESFKEEFESSFLKSIEERVKVYKSDDMTNLNVDLKKYQSISSEVIVRFLESNKESFTVDEEVKLSLELKNVQTLYIKIFEFNTETYYKKTLQPFNTGVNLDGLIASIEKKHEYRNPPNKKFSEAYSFPELVGKVGLFIVEFIGNGMSARAVIKKGSLSLIHTPTVAGHLAYVLDESKQICSGPKTGVFFDGQYYPADQDQQGKIFIPYGKSYSNTNAILLNNGFAQLCNFERLTESYAFNAWIYLNSENLLIGNKSSVVVRPFLTINQREAQLEVLKGTKITLTTLNYIDQIPVTKTFENVKFRSGQDTVLDFQVPAYLKYVNVSIETEVFNVTQQQKQKFTASKQFDVNTHEHSCHNCDVFLRRENGEYILYLLGKNGEPKPDVNIKLNVVHSQLLEQSTDKEINVKTDGEGRVKLGSLKHVMGVFVKVPLYDIEQPFMINKQNECFSYPQQVDIIENDTLEFPVLFKEKKRTKVSLIRKNDGVVLEDCFEKLEFAKQEDKDYNLIRLSNLPDGQYDLNLKNLPKVIKITVHKGKYWQDDSFILKRTCLMENASLQKMIKIASVNIEENKQGSSDVTIKLDDFSKDTRVHVFATQFQQPLSFYPYLSMQKMLKKSIAKALFPFAMWKNIFMSNRELSDEFRYVFDRKYAGRFQGNTLERPRLVLKRTYYGPTQVNQEVLKQGSSFPQAQEQLFKPQMQQIQQIQPLRQQQNLNSIQPRAMMDMDDFCLNNYQDKACEMAYEEDDYYCENYNSKKLDFEALMGEVEGSQEKISEFQNFLQHAPLALFNLLPDASGAITFSVNLSHFTCLDVLAVDASSVATLTKDLEPRSVQKRDLSLKKTLEVSKGFTESRSTKVIDKAELHYIEDITSTEIQIIDDMSKVKGVMEELMKTTCQNVGAYSQLIDVFMAWPKYDNEEKLKQFNKNLCNELNVYIYLKDREFFDATVRPFLLCKMEKRFVDYYLLEQFDHILHHAQLDKIDYLNAMEKCFLIDALAQRGLKEEATKVVEYIKARKELNDTMSVDQKNKVFDTVLNLNMMKNVESPPHGSMPPSLPEGLHMAMSAPMMPARVAASAYQAVNQASALRNRIRAASCDYDDEENSSECEMEECERPVKKEKEMKKKVKAKNTILKQRDQQIKRVKLNFEEVQSTNQYVEQHYFKQTYLAQSANLIQANAFWLDYAMDMAKGNHYKKRVVSANFVDNASQSVAALMTFAVLNLPFEAKAHTYQNDEGRGMTIKAGSHFILFQKEVKEAPQDLNNDILVTHRYVVANSSETQSAAMPEEFLVNKAYQCEVIMTNVSPQQKNFSVLYQIPKGSLPLMTTKYMKSLPKQLSPYTTTKEIFYFYFPGEGEFAHFPSSVAEGDKVVAKSQTHTLRVVKKLSINKKETFRDILQTGSKNDVLDFMKTHNLLKSDKGFSVSDMLWMLKDHSFFLRVIEILRQKCYYHEQVWQFGFYHKEEAAVKEYLTRSHYYIKPWLGHDFSSRLAKLDNEEESKHVDFYPLLNSRAHLVGDVQNWTLNLTLKQNYEQLLLRLSAKKHLTEQDKFMLVYHFQIQDRITEAIALFKTIDMNELKDDTLKIQYDYMSAYFDFFTGEGESFKVARAIVRKYEDYPIAQWRILFLEILDQLNEYDGEAEDVMEIDGEVMTEEQKKLKYKQSIKKEPRLAVEVASEHHKLVVEIANIRSLVIKFYIIDAEILFSRTPFLQKSTEEFSYVKPCHVLEQELQNPDLNSSVDTVTYLQQGQKFDVEIPEHLKTQNMVVEINGDGKQIFKTYYSAQIQVNIIETYGELKVTDQSGNALSRVYVKVYAQRKGGSTSDPFFFKDGYTDVRGKFEYAQTSGNKLKDVQRFAILVMSDTLGSIIKECDPPKQDSSMSTSLDEPTFNQRKEQRIISKVNNWRQNKSRKGK